jgi:hypothetical protein
MNNYYIYKINTGQITRYTSHEESNEGEACVPMPDNMIEGYVENGNIIPFPPQPYIQCTWNWTDKKWEDLRSPEVRLNIQWTEIKGQRNRLLEQSDWRVVKATDTGIPISQSWKDYRQALRDITTQTDPFNITWPVAPT